MIGRRGLICGTLALWTIAALPAEAARETPEILVRALYGLHADRAGGERPPLWEDAETAPRFFTPALLELFAAAAARARAHPDEVPALDGDPFYDAQDWDIANLVVTTGEEADGRATVTVTFDNFGEPRRLDYLVVWTEHGLRIDDIRYDHGEGDSYTLTELLSGG